MKLFHKFSKNHTVKENKKNQFLQKKKILNF